MAITRITDGMPPDPMRIKGTSAEKSNKSDKAGNSAENNGVDGANVSKLSKIVAKHTSDLHKHNDVRPEKTEQFKSIADSDINLTDEQIDTILTRMANT